MQERRRKKRMPRWCSRLRRRRLREHREGGWEGEEQDVCIHEYLKESEDDQKLERQTLTSS